MELKKLILAPMAGVADGAMRAICVRHGAEFTVTEMVSAAAVYYKDKKTYRLAEITQAETPCAVQVFGHDPDIVAYAITALYEAAKIKPAAFDVNMGCPVKKVVRGGDGSALMRDIRLAERIISAAVKVSPVPVTVKMRAGFDKDSINAPELAKAAEAAGASALCVHGRTREDMYKQGTVRRGVIADVVKAVNIPVAANGDIFTAEDALSMLHETGAAAVAVARGALGNPFIFEEIRAALGKKDYTPPTDAERIEAAKEHIRLIVEEKGEKAGIQESRKHAAWYLKGMRGAAWARQTVNTVSTEADMIKILDRVSEGLTV
ncbi:MAG: tRNA dihydrouridine synthase DusB [Clostridia bacterium]|nr:tRNA dihydrouridine synthase DusB [Clostridia bacterium]